MKSREAKQEEKQKKLEAKQEFENKQKEIKATMVQMGVRGRYTLTLAPEILAKELQEDEEMKAICEVSATRGLMSAQKKILLCTNKRILVIAPGLTGDEIEELKTDSIASIVKKKGFLNSELQISIIGNKRPLEYGACEAEQDTFIKAVNELINKTKVSSQVVINKTSKADELLKLKELLDSGVLTDEEFTIEKEKILNN